MSPSSPAPTVVRLLEPFGANSPPANSAEAAVIILLREGLHDAEVLLIERAVREDDPASGQVALPGGHVERGDRTLVDTALREFAEEVGLSLDDLASPPRFVGLEDAPRFGITVGVFAAALSPDPRRHPDPSPGEVADVFWMPVRLVRETVRVPLDTSQGGLVVDAVPRDGRVLWGFTLRVLQRFLDRADSWAQSAATGVRSPSGRSSPRPNGL